MLTTVNNIVYDAKYATQIQAKPVSKPANSSVPQKDGKKRFTFLDGFFRKLFPSLFPAKPGTVDAAGKEIKPENVAIKDQELRDQVKYILELPDDQYSDDKLTSKIRQYIVSTEKQYNTVIADYKSHISPSYREFTPVRYNISGLFGKSYYAQSYPSYIDALWTRDIL